MTNQRISASRGWTAPNIHVLLHELASPMPPARLLGVAMAAIAIATLYCQLWCLVAFPSTERMPMPIQASLAWSFSTVAPWLIGFELCKRRTELARSWRGQALVLVGVFVFAAFLSIVIELGLDGLIGVPQTRPLSLQIAGQLPPAVVIGLAVALSGFALGQDVKSETAASDALAGLLARVSEIDWIEAAGNYVEAHGGGRTTLYRATMRELEQTLDPVSFTRIHRSIIVNTSQIEARVLIGGMPGVRLRDGTILKIGGRYAVSLELASV